MITDELIDRLQAYSDSARTVARNAVSHAGVESVAFDRAKVVATPTVVSHKVDDWKVTSQKKSGRCWLFSSLEPPALDNPHASGPQGLRVLAELRPLLGQVRARQLLPDRHHCYGRDRRSGRSTPAVPPRRRSLRRRPVGHGCVPVPQARPRPQDRDARDRILGPHRPDEQPPEGRPAPHRPGASCPRRRRSLRGRDQRGQGSCAGRRVAHPRHLPGRAPASFEWEWRDDSGEFHRDGVLTPREFYSRYVDVDLTQYVCLVDDPRAEHPKATP